jgi:hypothetical protein
MVLILLEDDPHSHSLIFTLEKEATEAQEIVEKQVAPFDIYIDADTDGTSTWEVRFLTTHKLSEIEVTNVLALTQPDTYAMNCDSL